MAETKLIIPLKLNNESLIELHLSGESSDATIFFKEDAIENGEASFQIKEGCFYEYKITDGYSLKLFDLVSQSKFASSMGRISPNINVGTITIDVLDSEKIKCGELKLEVQSVKTTYREDYRHMLEEITEKCTDLLLQHSSLSSQKFEVDFNADAKTLYQRFAFIKSILESIEFNDAVHKILTSPVTKWKESEVIKDIRGVRRFKGSAIRQLTSSGNRIELPASHPLKELLHSIPSRIKVSDKTETADTPENRFIKHALIFFQTFCSDFKSKLKDNSRIQIEAGLLIDKLEQYLSHSVFKEISTPTTLPLNSPVLQRKEGYREILRVWLMFDLAAKMIWKGGDDVYDGNKRDVAVLYEYWLFFKLLEIIREVFGVNSVPTETLIENTADGLGLKLKQGKHLPVEGIFTKGTRRLRIEFSYNKTFSGDKEYPASGSWSRNLRPDYTLSIWPDGITQSQAEEEELVVHIHFDAKYKVENLQEIFGKEGNLDEEKEEQKKGTYKRADLLKMHTYKDAIRRTAGAYVLYPGNNIPFTKSGFHELIPGLGAFSIRPSRINDGTEHLKKFLNEIVIHFMNRASQREKISLKTFETYQEKIPNQVNESLPETFGLNRKLIPDETFVLVGFYKSPDHLSWIEKERKYNFRTGTGNGSLALDFQTVSSKYLLLHTVGEKDSTKLWEIESKGPKVYSKNDLLKFNYPSPSHDFYLVIDLKPVTEKELVGKKWKFKNLKSYKKGNASAFPFTCSLADFFK